MRGDSLRVALIDPSLFTPPYDAALAAGLRAIGHEVKLYGPATRAGGEHVPHFYRAAARAPQRAARVVKGASHVFDMAALAARLARERPDVIHFQWAPLPAVDRWFLPRLRRIAPLVLTVHDSTPFNGNPSSRLQRLGAHSILARFDALIAHTGSAVARLQANGVANVRLHRIAHGLLGVQRDRARSTSGATTIAALVFGKVKPYKGIDVLIDAVGRLAPAVRERLRIQVVGQAYMPTAPLLERAARLGVHARFDFDFRFVPDAEAEQLFERADVLLFPYRTIDASGVLMVALAAGRPVIASRIGNFAELLADGREALLVPPDDPGALADALTRFVADAALRRSLAAGAAALRDSVPSWVEIARATEAVYRGLTKELA